MFPAPEPEARMPAARNLRGPLRARNGHLRVPESPAHPRDPPPEADGTPAPAIAGEGHPHPIRLTEPDPGSCFLSRSRKPRLPAARNLGGPLRGRKEHLRSAAQNGRLPSRNRKTFRSVARTYKKAAGPIRTRTGNRRLHKRRGNETARYGGGRGDDRELPGNGTDTQGLRRWCPQYDAERSHTDRDHRRRAKSPPATLPHPLEPPVRSTERRAERSGQREKHPVRDAEKGPPPPCFRDPAPRFSRRERKVPSPAVRTRYTAAKRRVPRFRCGHCGACR